jgi:hypothetical protein
VKGPLDGRWQTNSACGASERTKPHKTQRGTPDGGAHRGAHNGVCLVGVCIFFVKKVKPLIRQCVLSLVPILRTLDMCPQWAGAGLEICGSSDQGSSDSSGRLVTRSSCGVVIFYGVVTLRAAGGVVALGVHSEGYSKFILPKGMTVPVQG